jgi:hypothetical protein
MRCAVRSRTRLSAVISLRRILPFFFVSIHAASLCSESGSADAPASRPAKAAPPAKRIAPPGLKWRVQKLFADNNEGCAVADFNRDGKLDVSAGEAWYAGPGFKERKPLRKLCPSGRTT